MRSPEAPERLCAVPGGVPDFLLDPVDRPSVATAGPFPDQRDGILFGETEAAHEATRRVEGRLVGALSDLGSRYAGQVPTSALDDVARGPG